MDLGTGKVTAEEIQGIPHHLLDVAEPMEAFSLARYQELAYDAIDAVIDRGNLPFLVGGTGLYLNAVTEGYNLAGAPPDARLRESLAKEGLESLYRQLQAQAPEAARSIHPNDRVRTLRALEKLAAGEDPTKENESSPRYRVLTLGVTWPRDILYRRIADRLRTRLEAGMVDEVRGLLEQGVTGERLWELGLEYRFTSAYISGEIPSYEEYFEQLCRAIRRFAKRQMTWFRRDSSIHWLNPGGDMTREALGVIQDFLQKERCD